MVSTISAKSGEECLADFLRTVKGGSLNPSDGSQLTTKLVKAVSDNDLSLHDAYEIVSDSDLLQSVTSACIDARNFLCSLEMFVIKRGNIDTAAHYFSKSSDLLDVYNTIVPSIKNMLECFYG